jgi:hypothetical protein
MADDERRLTTLPPGCYLAMLLLTLVTPTRRFSVTRGRTATNANALVVCALVLGEIGEDRCAPSLDRKGGEERDER